MEKCSRCGEPDASGLVPLKSVGMSFCSVCFEVIKDGLFFSGKKSTQWRKKCNGCGSMVALNRCFCVSCGSSSFGKPRSVI